MENHLFFGDKSTRNGPLVHLHGVHGVHGVKAHGEVQSAGHHLLPRDGGQAALRAPGPPRPVERPTG